MDLRKAKALLLSLSGNIVINPENDILIKDIELGKFRSIFRCFKCGKLQIAINTRGCECIVCENPLGLMCNACYIQTDNWKCDVHNYFIKDIQCPNACVYNAHSICPHCE